MNDQIVIAGAGYAGLHIALRIGDKAQTHGANVTLIDKYDYHQILTELPRVAAGSRPAGDVRVPLDTLLDPGVRFVRGAISGFDFGSKVVKTEGGDVPYTKLVLALGSRPNDFGIAGLKEHALSLWSVDDAKKILSAIDTQIAAAAIESDDEEKRRLLTVVIGGGGATGVELAGELAEVLPELLKRHDLEGAPTRIALIEAGPTIMLGSTDGLIKKAMDTLTQLGVEIYLNTPVVGADERGFDLKESRIEGGVLVWAGGVKAPEMIANCGLPTGRNGRLVVDANLRVAGHPEIYVAGDIAYLVDEKSGRPLPPTAQVALEEGETVAHNLLAEWEGKELEEFKFLNKGYVISVGGRNGVADVAGLTLAGRPAMILKNAIEWEYRQSVKHLKGWTPV